MAATSTTSSMMLITILVVVFCVSAFVADGRHVADNGGHGHHIGPNNKGGGDLVAQACLNASQQHTRLVHNHNVSREFCESALRSDKRSAMATHPRDLALVAMDLVQRGAGDADAKLGDVMKLHPGDKLLLTRLEYCRVDIVVVARIVQMCHAMVQEYKPSLRQQDNDDRPLELDAQTYFECADKLRDAAEDCWGNYTGPDVLGKQISEVVSRTSLAKAMIEQMLGVLDSDE